jgi:diguanylate cyclase (GGDEF)-like protein
MSTRNVALDRLAVWLLGSRETIPAATAVQLMNGLFSSVPIFLGGVINTIAIAFIAASRHPTAPFVGWLLFEMVLGAVRLGVLIHGKRAMAAGRIPPRLLSAVLSCTWACSVGFGTFICILSADWVLATLTCLSAAAMICGMCLRNFGTPRLAAVMVFSALTPCAVAGLLTDEAILPIISVQLPIFTLTILSASFALHKMLISWISALGDLERSQSLNETILQSSPDCMLILDEQNRVVFCNRQSTTPERTSPVGREWLSLLPAEDLAKAKAALASAKAGRLANLVVCKQLPGDQTVWFDLIVNRTADGSGRLIVVARDITHQKRSEERALWMAQHDALTGLPNRAVVQERLDAILTNVDDTTAAALLIVDVDNFKSVNDTLGHDGGDALLCAFAARLRAAVAEPDLVARTGGDEFALIVTARSEAEVERIAARIFEQLREPVTHGDRLLECAASIGASLIPRDGQLRSEIMKTADIALYAAKSGGRAQLRIFEPAMMAEVERHQAMIASARYAVQRDTLMPYYQPKVSLRTARIVGFEALLRWHDREGALRGPDALAAAFEDPMLSGPLSDRMLEKVLHDIARWTAAGVEFGHIAVNVTGQDFRRGNFAQTVLARLRARGLPPSCIQIEVTENVFLGQGADDVEAALKELSASGIRIALDDFGTGYASLSHLNQFPVDLLKIDRSFVQRLGSSLDAEAISSTVINLGRCLGLEVIAEGIETPAQEALLVKMGCDTGQGFLYAAALPAEEVPAAILHQDSLSRTMRRA